MRESVLRFAGHADEAIPVLQRAHFIARELLRQLFQLSVENFLTSSNFNFSGATTLSRGTTLDIVIARKLPAPDGKLPRNDGKY